MIMRIRLRGSPSWPGYHPRPDTLMQTEPAPDDNHPCGRGGPYVGISAEARRPDSNTKSGSRDPRGIDQLARHLFEGLEGFQLGVRERHLALYEGTRLHVVHVEACGQQPWRCTRRQHVYRARPPVGNRASRAACPGLVAESDGHPMPIPDPPGLSMDREPSASLAVLVCG